MPPPFVPAPNVVKAELIFLMNAQRIENVFHILSGDALTLASLDRIQGKLLSWYNTWYKPGIVTVCTLLMMRLSDQTVQNGLYKEYVVNVAGTWNTSPFPNNVTVAVKHSTGLRGRSYRGRTFVVGLGYPAVSGQVLTFGTQVAFIDTFNNLRTILGAGGIVDKFVIVSRQHDKVWRTTAAITPVLASTVDANLDSMRRRLTGRGA